MFVILDLMDGDLTSIIRGNIGKLSEEFCKWSLYQVAKGLLAMHNKNVLHRDIKSDNILFKPDGTLKICDMGFSVFLSEQKKYRDTQRGTINFVSPEIAQGIHYSKEVDIWAFGCLAIELALGYPPFFAHRYDAERVLELLMNEEMP